MQKISETKINRIFEQVVTRGKREGKIENDHSCSSPWLGLAGRHCGLSNWVRHNPHLQAVTYIIWQSKHLLHLCANYKRLLLSGQRNYKTPPLIRWSSEFSLLSRRNIKSPFPPKGHSLPWPSLWAVGCTDLGRFRNYIVGRSRVQHTLKVFLPGWRYVEQLKIPEKSQLKSSVHCYYTLYTFVRNMSILKSKLYLPAIHSMLT